MPRWQATEDPNAGVHPGGYDEGAADFVDRLNFYAAQEVGGPHVKAVGRWPACLTERTRVSRALGVASARASGAEAPCGVAEITAIAFEPTSAFAL
mgnify:CR=1 FL=1|jgi:hypothetical protein